jgi:hypothetical protein
MTTGLVFSSIAVRQQKHIGKYANVNGGFIGLDWIV